MTTFATPAPTPTLATPLARAGYSSRTGWRPGGGHTGPVTKPIDRPHVVRFDRDRVRQIEADEAAAVTAELAGIADERARLDRAIAIVNAANKLDAARDRQVDLALSLWAHDEVRAVNVGLGRVRQQWHNLRTERLGEVDADQARLVVAHVPAEQAVPELARLTERILRAEARAAAALPTRNQIALAGVEAGWWTGVEIAARMGVNKSWISRLWREQTGSTRNRRRQPQRQPSPE